MPGILFEGQKPFNSYPGKYSWDNWNEAEASGKPDELRNLRHLVKGNFMYFMNVLLDFEPNPVDCHPWIPKKERKLGAKR